jgi:hypothetical protein
MDLIPRALVIGGFIPPAPPGQQQVTADRLNRTWSEVAPLHGFTQLQIAPDQSSAEFLGRTPDNGVTIRPPLIQVRATIETTAANAADSAESIFRVVFRHLGVSALFNLGIKHIYTAPAPDNDARTFILRRVLRRDDEDLAALISGSPNPWAGVKYLVPFPDHQYTVIIEPWQLDQMQSLFIDLDALFPGEAHLDSITSRARDAQEYLSGAVGRYLDEQSLQ